MSDETTLISPVDARTDPRAWSVMDLFIGEYGSNRATVDVSRVQQFMFTLVVLAAYATLLWGTFEAVGVLTGSLDLPPLGKDAVGLLALSHVGYLAAKGAQG